MTKKTEKNSLTDTLIFESASEGICLIDTDYNIIRVNKALENIFKVCGKEIIRKKCYDIFACIKCNTSECPLKKILKGEKVIKVDSEKCLSFANSIYCSLSVVPFYGTNGKIEGIIKTFIDRSKKKIVEDELYLKSRIIDEALTAISSADSSGNINFVNRKFLELWGYKDASEVIGKPVSYFFKNKKVAEKVLIHSTIKFFRTQTQYSVHAS
jgi:PAS domain S-box-containing protein